MANRIIAWKYTSDLGNTYVYGVNQEIVDQTDGLGTRLVAGSAPTSPGAYDPLPVGFKPRRGRFTAAGKRDRLVTLFQTSSVFIVGTSATLAIEDSDASSTAYTYSGLVGEQKRRRTQAAA